MKTLQNYFSKAGVVIAAVLVVSCIYFTSIESGPTSRSNASDKKKIIFIGVDGLSRENFDYAQKNLGLFGMFKNVSSHVAPFPSISDYSWNILMHARDVYGQRGMIKNYEAAHYNYSKNNLIEDPREYFRRIGSDSLYFEGFFDYYLNPYIEALLYFPTEELPRQELKQIKDSLLKDSGKLVDTVMIASVDALSHTRPEVMGYLKELDAFLNEVKKDYEEKKVDLEIILVSDHGQAARYTAGEEPEQLLVADFNNAIKRASLNRATVLADENDIALPIMALGNYAIVNFKNLNNRLKLVRELQKEIWFEQAIYVESGDQTKKKVSVYGRGGNANIEITKTGEDFQYRYTAVTGNPLKLPENAFDIILSDHQAKEILGVNTPYPDSLFRIAQTVWQQEAEMPDMIVTMGDHYRIKGSLDGFTRMFNTHGSLSRKSSLGIVATTNVSYKLPVSIRTQDVLKTLKLNPFELAKNRNKGFNSKTLDTYNKMNSSGYVGIATDSAEFTNQRIFGLINKTVHYSSYVLDTVTLGVLADFIKPLVDQMTDESADPSRLDRSSFDVSHFDLMKTLTPQDFATITDLVLKYGDINKIKIHPKFLEIQERLKSKLKISDKSDVSVSPYTVAAKKAVMKAYGVTFLLERALNIPEFDTLKDTRDIKFWQSWMQNRGEYVASPHNVKKDPEAAKELFAEIYKERRHAYEIFPAQLPLLYNRLKENPENITVVYIPGIYNSIFDNEIFRMGLDALSNNLGVRVISPSVLSGCSSNYNADIILKTIKDDILFNKERTRQDQKYFVIGYSKGGMDALHAFNKDPNFIKENVLGLLTIASPLAGSAILNKTDLPVTLLELLSPEKTPEICQKNETAASSITPLKAAEFMQKNAMNLVGLTRYYSLSLKSEINESHLFMKATKTIAKFNEPNDGVVTVASSRFPDAFQAIDLGVVQGDHLSGIVANHFPQEAFMEAAYLSLLELDAFNASNNKNYNQVIGYDSPFKKANDHIEAIGGIVDKKAVDEKFNAYKKSISKEEKEKIAKEIKAQVESAVKGTSYDVSSFNISVSNSGEVELTFAKKQEDIRYLTFWKNKNRITVSNAEDIVKIMLGNLQKSGRNLLNDGVEIWRTYPVSDRPALKLPANDLAYVEEFRINLQDLDKFINMKKVTPMTTTNYPEGFGIVYDHRRVVDFRKEYQLNYESSAPMGPDDNSASGWATALTANNSLEAKLASANSSIRLSSYAMRFSPKDFGHVEFNLQVNKSVPGANVLFNGSGKDDSAFQIWFSIRELRPSINRELLSTSEKVRLFGYYFGDKISNAVIKKGEVYQNYYSFKNFFVVTLPEAKQVPIGLAPEDLQQRITSTHDFRADLKQAFPDVDPNNLEIIGITIQHDSNDMKGSSEALFKHVKFLP